MKSKRFPSLLLAAALLAASQSSHAATFTWDSGNTANGTTIDPADGTWNTTAGNNVWNNAGTNGVWAQTSATSALHRAIFGGADGTYAITVGQALATQKMTFANSGYTLSAASPQEIRVTLGGNNTGDTAAGLAVNSGKITTIGNNVTVTGATTLYIGNLNGTAGGTLNIESGGMVGMAATSNLSTVIDGDGTIVNVKTGGTLRLRVDAGDGAGANTALVVGQLGSSQATLNVQGGTVLANASGTNAGFYIGNQGQGTVTLTSGTITVSAAGQAGVTFGNAGSGIRSQVLNLDGGILTTSIVKKGAGTNSTATFNFHGGTLTANANNATFMQGLENANVKSGGAKIDTGAFDITIAQNLLADSISTGGGLTKSGTGNLTLTGANTFTGSTVVSAGLLTIGNSLALQNSVFDTTNSIASSSATTGLKITVPTLTLGGLSGNKNLVSLFDLATNAPSGVTAITLNPGAGQTPVYSGNIVDGADGMTLTKTGLGSQTLSGANNTYTGATTVSAGTLFVTGALSNSAVTVEGAGTIGGNGTLANGLTIAAGGNLDLTGATLNPDGSSTGILSLTGGTLTLGNLTFADLVGWDWLAADPGTYKLIDGGLSVELGATAFTNADNAFVFGNGNKGYFTPGSLNAVIVAIPEPSTALLGGLGALFLLRRRRN